jgi:dipeptidyl aminopeptidase/acylaminoacyl peptidase
MADDPQISPDGSRVAWVQSWIEAADNRYRSAIVVSDLAAGTTEIWTGGSGLETRPRWSPSGNGLIFLRADPAAGLPKAQLCYIEQSHGAVRVLTQLAQGVQDARWSPDGTRLVLTTRVLPGVGLGAHNAAVDDNNIDAQADLYHRYTQDVHIARRRKWKMDSAGYFGESRQAVAVMAAPDQGDLPPTLVAVGDFDLSAPVWSPDSRRLAVIGNLHADADHTRRQSIYLLDVAGELPTQPTELFGLADMRNSSLAWSPDGTQLAVAGHDNVALGHYGNQRLWLVDVATGTGRQVLDDFDFTLGQAAATDLARYGGDDGLHWVDEQRILALVSMRGQVQLCAIDLDSALRRGKLTQLTEGEQIVAAYSADRTGQGAALLVRTAQIPGDLFLLEDMPRGPNPRLRRISAVNQSILDEVAVSTPQHFTFQMENRAGGQDEIDAWFLPPVAPTPGARVPLVYFHGGGPGGMRSSNFMFEYQVLAAAGYAVLFCNARGCQSYGEAFCTAILGDWGGADYADVLRCVDEACARAVFVDGDRVAIVGGSYGGYMVNWAIGHTSRFCAAVADRSVTNRLSSYGTSDIGHTREFEFGGGPPWETAADYLKQSPLTYIGGARTPTLVIHSGRDERCPVEQGEQLYLALKQLGVPTRLVRFPDESHELSRSGRPWHRVFRLDQYLAWFAAWLDAPGTADGMPDKPQLPR